MTRGLRAIAAVAALALGACATNVPAPVASDATPMSPARAYDVWERVLTGYVDAQGRVDFRALADNRADLDRFVAWVYAVSPESQPGAFGDPDDVLAYHLNAYNALAMYNVIATGIPDKLGLLDRLRFFKLREVQVGGVAISLYDYENDVIRMIPDARLHVGLNCMAVSCPRLPREAFRPDTLDAQLDAAARGFYNNPRHVQVDHDARTVRLSAILDFYTEDFLIEAPTLVGYVNRYALPALPTGYTQKFLDYDWTINAQPQR